MSLMLDDEVALGNDSRYKSFTVAIERILKQFEYSTEWADLITYLVKVKKTIESNSKFPFIPKRIILLKRLAQCLHPALPSGVHLKTLEVYETIFRIIDKRHLQRDIILYSYGLFSLLPAAALPVKPVLLTLYELYFLPLDEALNPVLTGFLIGLFSSLEEGADYYDRVILLLDNLANRIDEFYFYTCVWSAIHLTASVRYSAVTFILNRFDRRKNIEDQFHLIGLSIETTVSAVCTCLHDSEQSLVQRSVLDFLLICLPIHKKQLSKLNLMKMMTGMLHILLKRDMSLNRRIYTWFLGTNNLCKDITNQQHQINDLVNSSSYFIRYTREILIESLRNKLDTISKNAILLTSAKSNEDDNKQMTDIINSLPSPWTLTKLIRVLLVLVDTSDIGPIIIESIFVNYLLLVYEQVYQPAKKSISINIQQENNYSEILKTFHMLLDALEPYFIWEFLTKNFDIILNQQQDKESITAGATMEQICSIINMLLDISSQESSTDIHSEHLPEMLYRLIKIMNNNIEKLTPNQITLCIELLLKILKHIIPTDTNHHLFTLYRSIDSQQQIFDDNLTDSDTKDDNEYSIPHTHKLQNPTLITEHQDTNDIELLLHQMVRKVEREIYKPSNAKRTASSTKTILESINHIEKSIKLYKIFFHRFIITYFIDKNQILLNDKFQSIYSILQNKTNDNLLSIFNQYQQSNEFQLKLNDNIDQYKTPFEDCCKLLIEFCCFPRQSSINDQPISPKGKPDFDDWLIDLCILSLCKTENFSLQTIAISVLLELSGYTLKIKKSTDVMTNNLSLFLNETDFFQYIIAYLWEYLSEKYNREYNLKASYTLLIIHSMLPTNLCEDLIRNQLPLINNQQFRIEISTIEGYKRFFKLWNSIRDISNITKSFQHCLIYVLSILKESNHNCLQSLVQQWTYDCFNHGDMCRIFDILLIMLLHSDTTRISVQQYDSVVDQDFSLDSNDQILINSSFNNGADETNEITFSLASDGANNEDYDDDSIFDNETEQEDIGEEKRIRASSYANLSETIHHIKSSPRTSKSSSISSLSAPILSNLLSFSSPMVIKSIKQRTPTMPPIYSRNNNQSESTINTLPRSHSASIDNIINYSTDSQNTYILLYTQSYDYNRVTLSLNIIESLIDLLPQQLIHTLLITSNIQSSSISIYNNQMHELFLKHRRIFDLSNENNQEYQSYLYLLLNILLIYTYSYCQKYSNIQENFKIHIHTLILLTRICHDLSYICMDNVILINYVINLLKKISFQKIILCLFNRILNKKTDLLKFKIILYDQLTKQYLKQLIKLLEKIILIENIIYSNDFNLINQSIVNHTIFLSTILQYLKQIHFIENHRYIISFVVRILPHCGSALKTISIRIIEQICRNLCFIVQYHSQQEIKIKYKQLSSFDTIDYIIHLIQRLSYICNYCLGNMINNTQNFRQTLCPQHWMKRISINANDLSDARQLILNKLSLILSSLLFIWKTLSIDQINSIWLVNNIKQIRETIIEFISSLTKSNGISFVRAITQCWRHYKRQQKSLIISKDNTDEIQTLINILMNINNYTINDMIYNMTELIRINDKKKQNYISWSLQFLLVYLEQQKNVSIDCWSTLAIMFKESLALSTSPSIIFSIIKILSFYIKQSPSLVEKRDLKDLQDITMRVLEYCNGIVASSLEQTNWLRKNFQVRLTQPDLDTTTDSPNEIDHIPDIENNALNFDGQSLNSSRIALTILSEHAAKLLDTVYNLTDEKDRVVLPYLQNLVINIMPYVRTHVLSNASSYRSASVLLMNISQYSYTIKAWRKEVFEQLFDTGFFQVDLTTLRSWKIIIDNMVTNEKPISFRDLLNKINTIQTGLFVSKEQEYEQRAMLIKRFAFIIYSSKKDQYNSHLPEIRECISDLIKLPQIAILYTQMFLFFRVLLIRISSKTLISFWPTLMTELIQVLLQLEQDLVTDIEGNKFLFKSNIRRMTMNNITVINFSNASLKMYLYACKLLDILLAMPYSEVDYFQFFRSAFVADRGTTNPNSDSDIFIAFSIRLTKLLEQKLQSMPTSIRDNLPIINNSNYPLLRLRTISNIIELFPFFNCLSLNDNFYFINEQIFLSNKINDIETSVLEDFVELWI